MIKSCNIFFVNKTPDYAIICIPGRGNDGTTFARKYHAICDFKNTVFVGPTPWGYAWYPMPISSLDQKAAISGLPRARAAIEAVVKAIKDKFGLPKKKIALVGFSAGGVMAIETAAHSDEPFALVASHCGAILEPNNLPKCRHPNMPVILTHNQDDYCFDWHERYLPMKEALVYQGYKTLTLEREKGDHTVDMEDIEQVALYLSKNNIMKQPKEWESEESWRKNDCILRQIKPCRNKTNV